MTSTEHRGKKSRRQSDWRQRPAARPSGHAWDEQEIELLDQHIQHLSSLPYEERTKVVAEHRRRYKHLTEAGWQEVTLGLWARGLIGPYTTREAVVHNNREQRAYDTYFKTKMYQLDNTGHIIKNGRCIHCSLVVDRRP
jgi:hypothetical protein